MKIIDQLLKQSSIKKEISFEKLLIGLVVGSFAIFMGMLALTAELL